MDGGEAGRRDRRLARRICTIGSVARQVGYGSPLALSTAFKRVRGVSPQQYKLAAKAS